MTDSKEIRLELWGHKDFYNLQDVIRLFYGLSSLHEEAEPAYLAIKLLPNSQLALWAKQGEVKLVSSYKALTGEVKASLLLDEQVVIAQKAKLCQFKPNFSELVNHYTFLPASERISYLACVEAELINSLLTAKRLVKKLVYDLLCEIEGLRFPWGSLTGIRPTYMATEIYHCLYNWRALVNQSLGIDSPYKLSDMLRNKLLTNEYGALASEEWLILLNSHLPETSYKLTSLWQEVALILRRLYDLSPDKAQLVTLTAQNENSLLAKACYTTTVTTTKKSEERLLSIYIGIPFCFTRCAYCSFAPRDGIKAKEELVTAYVTALIAELELLWPLIKGKIQTLYIGGGTPSALDVKNLERLCTCLCNLSGWDSIAEKTFEAGRADTITLSKLKLVKSAGFQHICVNPQSFKLETLQRIGRPAYADEIKDVMQMVRELAFPVCNMDLIFGLPGEKKSDMLYSLEQALSFNPENITIHTLAFKRKSWLGQLRQSDRSVPENIRSDEILQNFAHGLNQLQYVQSELHSTLTEGQNYLQAQGYLPYYMYRQKDAVSALENTGFARPVKTDNEGKVYSLGNLYNVLMMLDQTSVLGFGCCAMSKFVHNKQVERFSNARSVASYLENSAAHSLEKAKLIKRYFGE